MTVDVFVVTHHSGVIGAAATREGAQRILEAEAQARLRQFRRGLIFSGPEEVDELDIVANYYRAQMCIQPVAVAGLELVDE